jgi:hypothetical protein
MAWMKSQSISVDTSTARLGRPEVSSSIRPDRMELNHLWRYALGAVVVACCALFSAWSRIDLVEISVALDQSQADLKRAEADRARLELELATLQNPTHLSAASDELGLLPTVEIVPVPPTTTTPSP